MRNKSCPVLQWDDNKQQYNFDEIIQWEGAEVVWSDTFVGPKGEERIPRLAHWTLIDSCGFIGFDGIVKPEEENRARAAAAMFIYLFNHTELECSVCDQLAQSWAIRCIV